MLVVLVALALSVPLGVPVTAQASGAGTPAAALQADGDALDERLLDALRSASWWESVATLRQEHGDVVVLDALLDALERFVPPMHEPLVRSNAYQVLTALVADAPLEDAARRERVTAVVLGGLTDPLVQDEAVSCAVHLAPADQGRLLPALVEQLDHPDPRHVEHVCRSLGRIGAGAEAALPALEQVLRTPGRACARAAEARMLISGDVDLDAALYPTLDEACQEAVTRLVALMLARVGVPAGMDSPRRGALVEFVFGRLAQTTTSEKHKLPEWIVFYRLLCDETEPAVRERARRFLEERTGADDERVAEMARLFLDQPEAKYKYDEPPPGDDRVELLFRPRSGLLTAAETPRGLLAVSGTTLGTGPRPHSPELSTLFVWDVTTSALLHRIDDVRGGVTAARLAADGSSLVVGTRERAPGKPADGLLVYPFDGAGPPRVIPGLDTGVRDIDLFADGKRAATTGWRDHAVRIVDLRAGKVLHVWEGPDERTSVCVAVRPDGARVFVGRTDFSLQVRDAVTGAVLASGSTRDVASAVRPDFEDVVSGDPRMPRAAAFLPDGERVVVADCAGRLLVWDPRTPAPPTTLAQTDSLVEAIAVSPDGTRMLTAMAGTWLNGRLKHPTNFSVMLWKTGADAPDETLTGMWITPKVVALLSDGKRVLGVSDGALRVWRSEAH
jgi:WD40 repeat protein